MAARLPGQEVRRQETDTECPICFLNYAQVNQTKCCQASLCTECYLQVRPPKERVVCPFCNSPNLTVTLQQTLSPQAVKERQAEEQRALEASLRMRNQSRNSSSTANDENGNSKSNNNEEDPEKNKEQAPGFGSSLESDEHVLLLRQRSSSLSDTASDADLANLAMTVDERQALEAQLRAQQQSPLIQRMQQEEMERAFRNEREYLQQQQQQQRTSGGRRRRDWARLIQAFEEQGGGSGRGGIQSLEDLAMLEAAMRMASLDGYVGGSSSSSRRRRGGGEAQQSNTAADGDDNEGGPSPLRRRMLDSRMVRHDVSAPDGSHAFLGGSAIASQLIMRGMSEEEQLAMAIAASLEDVGAAASEGGNADAASNAAEGEEDGENNNNNNQAEQEENRADNQGGDAENVETDNNAVTNENNVVTNNGRATAGPVDFDTSFSESNHADDAPSPAEMVTPHNDSPAEAGCNSPSAPNNTTDDAAMEETVEAATTVPSLAVAVDGNEATTNISSETLDSSHAAPVPVEPIVAQTGLAVSEVLTRSNNDSSSAEIPRAEEEEEDDTESPHGTTDSTQVVVQDVSEVPVYANDDDDAGYAPSECKTTEACKLSDEGASTGDSILPSQSQNETVESS